MNTDRRPRTLTLAFAAVFAAAFFFAGYAARTATTAMAAVVRPTPPFDGNPSGHHLWPNYSAAMSGPTAKNLPAKEAAELKNSLKLLASTRLTIWYRTAKPGQSPSPHIPPPKCPPSPALCYTFTWKNMSITTWKPDPDFAQNGIEPVDVYGIIAWP